MVLGIDQHAWLRWERVTAGLAFAARVFWNKLRAFGQPSLKEQALFYLPLAATAFIIIITHSFFNAGLARLPNPEVLIAAFAVAKSLMHVFQSPVMMIRQTVTALIDHRKNFRKTLIALSLVVGGVVFVLAVTAFSGLSRWLFHHVMGLEGQTLDEAVAMLKILFIFPLLVSIRDFFSGLLIRFRTAPLIAAASVARVVYVALFVIFIEQLASLPGSLLASLMFVGGVGIETLIVVVGTRVLNGPVSGKLAILDKESGQVEPKRLTYPLFIRFFTPLIVTTAIYNVFMPIVNAGLARSAQPDLTLSVFAVAWGLGMVVLSPSNMLHQLPLRYDTKDGKNQSIRLFIFALAVLLALVMALIAFTNLGYLILRHWIGTSHEISSLASNVLKLMCVSPFLLATREYFWGILLKRRLTRFLWRGKLINLLCLLVVLAGLMALKPTHAAMVGALCLISGDAAECLFLLWVSRRHLTRTQI